MHNISRTSPAPSSHGVVNHQPSAPAQRFRLKIPVHYRAVGESEWLSGTTENISRSGVLFHTDHLIEPNAQLEITLVLPFDLVGLTSTEIVCRAEVVRAVCPGKFDPGPAVAARIIDYRFLRGVQAAQAQLSRATCASAAELDRGRGATRLGCSHFPATDINSVSAPRIL